MRQTLTLAVAAVLLAGTSIVAWPLAFGAPDEERPAKDDRPPRGKDDRPPPPPPPPGGPGHLDRVIEDLELSKAQKGKVEKIIKAHHDKMRKIMDKAREDLLKEMKAVLTKEQYREFEKAIKQGPPRRGPGGDDRPPPPPDKRGKGDKDRPPPPKREEDRDPNER